VIIRLETEELQSIFDENEKKNVSRVRKKTFYLKFIIRLFDGSNGATRRNLQTRSNILKKIIGIPNQPIRTKILPQKVCLVP
jgi:hypothetical protein